ncbi:Calx-beta domain-containing protein, partial [Dolichospermum circinale CS-539/09]
YAGTEGFYGTAYRYNSAYSAELDRVDFSGINRFQITGTSSNDSITTASGNDTINGGAGNDTINAGGGNDIIDGVNGASLTPGLGEIDSLTGGTGSDRFILGNATKVYYDDGNTLTNGSNDYADITDFNIGDIIQLQGTSSNYLLAVVGVDTQILINKPGTELDELIGIVRNQTGLSLTGTYFSYVSNVTLPTITLAVSPTSVSEDGTANLIYTFTRTGSTTSALTVNYGITGTADSSDYTGATPGTGKTITFAAGASTATLTIDPTADTIVESDETVALTLATGTGYTVGTTGAVTGTIANDDATITLAVSPSSVLEDGTTNLIYTFTRTGYTATALTVNYDITGTADSSDYTGATPGTGKTITFAAGATTATLTIDPTADNIVEGDETVLLNLTAGDGYTISTTTAVTGTITNDDLPIISVAATDSDAGETATGITPNPGTFTLTRTGDLTQAITVNYTLSGIATNGADYSSLPGTVNFAAGVSSATVTVTPTDDNIFEGTETAILTLATGAGYILGTTTSATVNITDNDPQPSISINDVSVTEGNSGTTNATFTLTLSHPSSQPITVNYATADGTATTADLDYNAATFTVTFAPGETSKTVNVAVVGDIKSENPETFTVNLSNATNATITKAQGVGTITNDDLPIITLAATDSNAGETATGVTPNPGTFTLTRTGDLTQPITVNYTLSGSATNATDYSSLPGTVNFAVGDSTAIVTVTPTDDNIFEGTETAILTLITGTGYALDVTTSAVVNIADNDLPSISLAVSPASVVEDGPTNLVYTFTRTGTTANALTVNYGVGGNATFNTDYTQTGADSFTATTGTITFSAGSSTATLTVDPTADTTVETDETVVLTLATAPGYTIDTPAAVTGTITNDDSSALPVISVAATDASAAETATGIAANPGQFTLTRLGGNINQAVTVNYTLTGTATNGTDYTSLPTSVTFAAGSSTAIVTVTPTDDTIFEATETAILTLATGTGYTVSTTNTAATVNITDNDLQPTINFSANQTIVEGNTNPQNVIYTVTLSNASTQTITV